MNDNRSHKMWDEDMLLAYVDNELDPNQAAAVQAAIRNDPEAQALVDLLRRSGSAVRNAFDAPLHEPVPARILAVLGSGPGEASAEAAPDKDAVATIVPLTARRPRVALRQALLPLAASLLALFLGFGGGYQFRGSERLGIVQPAGAPTDEAADRFASALYHALEAGSQGATFTYDDPDRDAHGVVTLLGVVDTSFGGSCHEFRHQLTRQGVASISNGLACRAGDGSWTMLVVPAAEL